jgi:hypothetical protein
MNRVSRSALITETANGSYVQGRRLGGGDKTGHLSGASRLKLSSKNILYGYLVE